MPEKEFNSVASMIFSRIEVLFSRRQLNSTYLIITHQGAIAFKIPVLQLKLAELYI